MDGNQAYSAHQLLLRMIKKLFICGFKVTVAAVFLPFWYLELLIPRRKNLFVFGSFFGQRYNDNSRVLYEYILNNQPHIKPCWITKNKDVYRKLKAARKPVEMAYSIKGCLTQLSASVAFDTQFFDFNSYTLNGAFRIRLWHGMPLKKIEYDITKGPNAEKGSKAVRLLKKIIRHDYIVRSRYKNKLISASDFFTPYLSSAFGLNQDCVWLTGLPRTDSFFKGKTEKIAFDLREKYKDSTLILYMPTFRLSAAKGNAYNQFDGNSFDNVKFREFLLSKNIVFLYKPHFNDRDITLPHFSDRFVLLDDDAYDDLYALVSGIDILATDYSSIYFDFLLLNKPVILTPFDYDEYVGGIREHYFDYGVLPGIRARNWDEFMDIVSWQKYFSVPEEYSDKFVKYNDGNSSKRCFEKTVELLERKKVGVIL